MVISFVYLSIYLYTFCLSIYLFIHQGYNLLEGRFMIAYLEVQIEGCCSLGLSDSTQQRKVENSQVMHTNHIIWNKQVTINDKTSHKYIN